MRISKKRVEQICRKKFTNCHIENFREITEAGLVNHIFELQITDPKKTLILKVYPKKWEHYKPEKEKFVFELIHKKTKLPVPETFILDKSKKILPNTYILMNKLGGIMLKHAKIPNKEKLFFELGKDLAELHKIKLSNFGWIYKDKISRYETKYSKPFNTMKEYFEDYWIEQKKEFMSAPNKKYGKIDKQSFIELMPKMDKFVERHLHLLDTKITPVFIHNDFSWENILVEKNGEWKISGILDVEFAKVADAELELERYFDPFMFNSKKFTQAFVKGYLSKKKLSKNFYQKKDLYQLARLFSWASFDGFVIGMAKQDWMEYFYSSIKKLLKT